MIGGECMHYYLMNKDRIVAEFNINTGSLRKWGKLPYGFSNILDWVKSRYKFSCARNVEEFFNSLGIVSTEDFIYITHCTSLSDTFWVKKKNSSLYWKDVSPFRNDYSYVISMYALEGENIGMGNRNYFSPVVSTDGSFPHTWKYNNGNIVFIKAGSKYTLGGSNSGREPYSEYYASKVCEYLGFNHVKYDIKHHIRRDGRVDCVTKCPCYTTEEVGSVPAFRLGLDTYEKVLDYCEKLGGSSLKTCLDMLFLDCLLLDTDRHFSNIEFLVNNDTQEVLSIAPIFDNNYALLPRFIEGFDTFDRDDYRARDGRTFEDLYKLVTSYKSYKSELISLKKFKFVAPEDVTMSDYRLKFLNDFLKEQVDYLLSLEG